MWNLNISPLEMQPTWDVKKMNRQQPPRKTKLNNSDRDVRFHHFIPSPLSSSHFRSGHHYFSWQIQKVIAERVKIRPSGCTEDLGNWLLLFWLDSQERPKAKSNSGRYVSRQLAIVRKDQNIWATWLQLFVCADDPSWLINEWICPHLSS